MMQKVSGDAWGRVTGALVVGLGGVMVLLPLRHAFREEEVLVELFIGIFPPIALGGLVVYGGYRLFVSGLGSRARWVFVWMFLGMAFQAGAAYMWVTYQGLHDHAVYEVGFMATNTVTGGAAIGLLIGFYDARRRQARELLVRSEEEFRGLVETSNDAIVTCGEDRRVRQWNSAATDIFGYSEDEVLGKMTDVLVPEGVRERHAEAFERFVKTGFSSVVEGGETLELEALHRDGHRVPVELSLSVHRHGGEYRVTAFVRDVTERREAERELRGAKEELEVLNRIVRHDIRNDMQLLMGWQEVLGDRVGDLEPELLQRMGDVAYDVVEMTEIARDFVDVIGGGEPELEPVDVADVVRDEVGKARERFEYAEFGVEIEPGAVEVMGTPMLASVFRNLLNNAVQHSDRDCPGVEVSVERDSERGVVVVRVADDGPGVPEEMRNSLFGKGEKGLESQGTGIGLYLVKTLAEQCCGQVRYEDNEPRGAVFIVELPLAEEGT